MKIGRNFTNMLETSFLSDEERNELAAGRLAVHDMDARVQIRSKKDIVNQLNVAKEIGLSHIELDGGVPNPYLEMTDKEILASREHAAENSMNISLHLPYTYVAASTCAFQESDRAIAVELMKQYIDFAAKLGCMTAVMHPGSVPFYQAVGEYLSMLEESLLRSLSELSPYASGHGIMLHLENNTAFDSYGVENDELIKIIQKITDRDYDLKYCFDIGHWFTRALPQFGHKLPDPPESIAREIPAGMMNQVHLNDFVIEGNKFKFHPPLHLQSGFLKEPNLRELAAIFRDKGVDTVVVETAVRDIDDLLNAKQILKDESDYLNGVFSI